MLPGLNAQNGKIDSLQNLLDHHSQVDTVRVNLLNEIASSSRHSEPEKSLNYAEEALKLANKINYKKGIADAFNFIGLVYTDQDNYASALEYYHKSLKLAEEIGYKKQVAWSLNNIGLVYWKKGNYPLALDYYQKSLKIFEEIGHKKGIAICLNNIGLIYNYQGNYPQALDYYQKSLKISEEMGNKIGIARTFNNIGLIYNRQGNYPLALEYYQKALKIFEEIGHKYGIANSSSNIGIIYNRQGNYPLALEYYQKSLKIFKEIGINLGVSRIHKCLGEVYLKKLKYEKALDYTLKSLKIGEELESLDDLIEVHQQLSEIYVATNNYKKAYENYVLYKQFEDSVYNEENIKKITGLEYQYEFDKEKQATKLEQEKKDALLAEKAKQQSIIRNSFIAGFILMALVVVLVWRNLRIRRKANKLLDKQNEKLIKLDLFKESMTGMIVHDLKNPLNGIINVSKLYSAEKQVQRMKQTGKQMLNMVLNILDVHKYEETKMIVDKLDYSLFDISLGAINEVTFLAEQKNIEIKNEISKGTGIKADKEIIERVFVNILSNATKYTPNNGKISVASPEPTTLNPQQIKITITDTGQGIPQDQLSKVFDKFGQVSAKESGTVRSTGLGLTFCKMAVEAHGGEIGVESEVENLSADKAGGTTFWFTLPLSGGEFTTNQIISKTSTQQKSYSLNTKEKEILAPYLAQLQETEIYKISELRKILRQIDDSQSKSITMWKEEIIKTIRSGNKEKYNELINT